MMSKFLRSVSDYVLMRDFVSFAVMGVMKNV